MNPKIKKLPRSKINEFSKLVNKAMIGAMHDAAWDAWDTCFLKILSSQCYTGLWLHENGKPMIEVTNGASGEDWFQTPLNDMVDKFLTLSCEESRTLMAASFEKLASKIKNFKEPNEF